MIIPQGSLFPLIRRGSASIMVGVLDEIRDGEATEEIPDEWVQKISFKKELPPLGREQYYWAWTREGFQANRQQIQRQWCADQRRNTTFEQAEELILQNLDKIDRKVQNEIIRIEQYLHSLRNRR